MSSLGGNSNGKTYISGDGVGDIDDDGDELLEYVGFGEADDVCEDDLETLKLDVGERELVEDGVFVCKLVEDGVIEGKLLVEGNLEKVTLDVWGRELREDDVVEGILEILEHGDGDRELVKDGEFDIVLNELEDGTWL